MLACWVEIVNLRQAFDLIKECKVLGHISVQDIINDLLSHPVVFFACKCREYVAVLVLYQEKESGTMMIL